MAPRTTPEQKLANTIAEFRATHGDRFDYSRVASSAPLTGKTRVEIVCQEHGPFMQQVYNHRTGRIGCPGCIGQSKRANGERQRVGQAEAVRRFREANGDRYDYSKTVYTGAQGRIVVTCLKHGDFSISAAGHLRGQGCRECRANDLAARLVDSFVAVHGDRFDYSRITSVGRTVEIVCRLHGPFRQRPDSHKDGRIGCKPCENAERTLTTQEWIRRFRAKHGEKFDYSRVVYTGSPNPVDIICPIHGPFSLRPDIHFHSQTGCESCGRVELRLLPVDEVMARIKAVHSPGRYTYEKFEFRGMAKKVTVTCVVHGDFDLPASSHLDGNGCQKCSGHGISGPEVAWMDAVQTELGIPVTRGHKDPAVRRSAADGSVEIDGTRWVIQYDGPYWHGRKGALERDERVSERFAQAGYEVLRLRGVSQWLPRLEDVPGAHNVHVPTLPSPESVRDVVTYLRSEAGADTRKVRIGSEMAHQ